LAHARLNPGQSARESAAGISWSGKGVRGAEKVSGTFNRNFSRLHQQRFLTPFPFDTFSVSFSVSHKFLISKVDGGTEGEQRVLQSEEGSFKVIAKEIWIGRSRETAKLT
jgi:hypothetical protein